MQWWKMHPRENTSTACVRREEDKLGPPAIAQDEALAPDPDLDVDKELLNNDVSGVGIRGRTVGRFREGRGGRWRGRGGAKGADF